MQLTPRTFWFSLNQTGWVKLSDAITGSSLTLPRANTTRFLFAFFNGDIRRADKFADDISNVSSVTMVLRKTNETGKLLYVRAILAAEFHSTACTYADWSAQRDWQVGFELSKLETNWAPSNDWDEKIWVAVDILLTDGSEVTVGHGTLQLVDPGVDTTDPITQNVQMKASQAESEAGTDNLKWMTPLRTFQAIHSWVSENLSLSWAAITGKPSTFPPSPHHHAISEVNGLQTALDGKQLVGNYQPAGSYATLVNGTVPASQLPVTALYPLGSSAYPSGEQYPATWTIKTGDTVIGFVHLTYDSSNRVTAVSATDSSGTALTHGNYTVAYDSNGNPTVVCTN